MNKPPDDTSSASHPANTQLGAPDAVHSRKPRIEVLRRAPAAISARDLPESPNRISIDVQGEKASRSSLDGNLPITPDHLQEAAIIQGHRLRISFRPMLLIILAAVVVIAGLLVYTYLASKNDLFWYTTQGYQKSSENFKPVRYPQEGAKTSRARESDVPLVAASSAEPLRDREVTTSSFPRRTAAPETSQAAGTGISTEPPSVEPEAGEINGDGVATVRAFYSALGTGDGASAAQSVVPGKRQSGPLSAASLSRYYSSFRRPLMVRSVVPVDQNTIRVAYDYVLANGQLCRGLSAVDVVRRGGRSLVSHIRTRGPC